MITRTLRAALASTSVVVAAAACATGIALHADAAETAPASATAPAFAVPPADAQFDYQIGEAYTPPTGVKVVSRDREAEPAAGLYNICYVNAFQVQPSEVTWWQQNHDDLLLRDGNGDYVVDGGWDEILLDISTAAKRTAVAAVVNGWIDGCQADGFQAVEPDNIDSYDRSQGLLSLDDAVAYLELLAPHAHADGLAIGQKNTTDLEERGKDAGLDFAVAEECGRYSECDAYTDVYGTAVIDIEYTDSAFRKACTAVGASISVVRRDVNVTAPGSSTYKYGSC